jgi:hypothetical protein
MEAMDALARLVQTPDPAPAEEPEPLTDDDRRALVAEGFVIEGPGA